MKKNTVVPHATESHIAPRERHHFAHIVTPFFRTLLFLFAAGMFLFSCEKDAIELSSDASMTSLTLTVDSKDYEITFKDRQGKITLPYSTTLPVTAKVAAVQHAAKATGVKVGNDVTIPDSESFTLTLTAEDKTTTQKYTVTIEKAEAPSSEAAITSLTLTVGDTDHEIGFINKAYTLVLSAGSTLPTAVGVKNITLSAGAMSDAGTELSVTNNAVTITVTAADGKTTSTYTVTLSVAESSEAAITSLTLTVGSKDHEISFTNRAYTLVLLAGSTLPATVVVKEIVLSDGAKSVDQGTQLTVTNNAVTITVTAENGTTTSTYTVTLSVAANVGAAITDLTLTVGSTDYEITLQGTRGTVVVPYNTAIPATVVVKEIVLSDGAKSVDQGTQLTVTNNAVTITVTAENGTTTSMYTVTLSVAANKEASIRSLKLNIAGTSYDVTFDNTQGSVALSYGTVIPARVNVASVALSDGATGVVMGSELTVTNNAVTITVTAEDGITKKTYTVTFSVAANNEASITSLKLSIAGSDYDVTFDNTQGSVTLSSGTAIPARVNVASVALSDGATGVVMGSELTVTNNAVTLTVTAEDGTTTKTYTVTLLMAANKEASITSLKLSVAGTSYDVTFDNMQGSVIVPFGTAIPARVNVVSVALSDGATGVVMGSELTVTNNAVTITVTAEDGIAKNTYTVRLTTAAGITSFTFEITDNENMALEATDRKRIVGTINQQAKTITFAQQSAYVYRDKLKATFGLSAAGATVQVGNMPQTSGTTEQDFTSPVSYVVRTQGSTETTTYRVTLTKSTMATIENNDFRAALQKLVPTAFTVDQLNIVHSTVINYGSMKLFNQIPKLTSLKGIEFFTAVKELRCNSNLLASLNVSRNTALTELNCGFNNLTSLDVSANTALTNLFCKGNNLRSLDVSGSTALTTLNCSDNSLPSLDVRANTALKDLDCSENNFPSLNISANTALTTLNCSKSSLPSLDVSANTALTTLNCSSNALASLEVSTNTALTTLDCSVNKITLLNLSKNTALTTLTCRNNALTSLDMTGMRSVASATALNIGTGVGSDLQPDNHHLATLRVNTAVQDNAAIVAMKTRRTVDMIITTVNNNGMVVCTNYIPVQTGGNCDSN